MGFGHYDIYFFYAIMIPICILAYLFGWWIGGRL
jgi:hypothetical protein